MKDPVAGAEVEITPERYETPSRPPAEERRNWMTGQQRSSLLATLRPAEAFTDRGALVCVDRFRHQSVLKDSFRPYCVSTGSKPPHMESADKGLIITSHDGDMTRSSSIASCFVPLTCQSPPAR